MKTIETCVGRIVGRCHNCRPDYDPGHRPNNYDCPTFRPVKLLIYEVKKLKHER